MIFAMEYKFRQCPDFPVKINGSKMKQVDRKNYLGLALDKNGASKYMKCAKDFICSFRHQIGTILNPGQDTAV